MTLKENNPDVQKKLLNRKSVNNVEWLCKTCNKHLKNNKAPPCAAINGLQFPQKPSFFYLNELECRLLAPRLAFQKLMQAPRGRQLKINETLLIFQQILLIFQLILLILLTSAQLKLTLREDCNTKVQLYH
jgi:hypothetical protein